MATCLSTPAPAPRGAGRLLGPKGARCSFMAKKIRNVSWYWQGMREPGLQKLPKGQATWLPLQWRRAGGRLLCAPHEGDPEEPQTPEQGPRARKGGQGVLGGTSQAEGTTHKRASCAHEDRRGCVSGWGRGAHGGGGGVPREVSMQLCEPRAGS